MPPAYQPTVEEASVWFGTRRITSFLPDVQDDRARAQILEEALGAAVSRLESAAAIGGYVVPLQAEEEGQDLADGVIADLKTWVLALALQGLRLGVDTLGESIEAEITAAGERLERLQGWPGTSPRGEPMRFGASVVIQGAKRA